MRNWNDMPPEIKFMIVGNMDFETRERLKMCSKADKTIVESTAFKIDKIEVEKYKTREEVEQVRIKLTVDGKHLKIFTNDCKVEFRWNDNEKSLELENKEEAFAWMEEYYAKYLLNDKMKIQYFSTDLNIPNIIANHEAKLKMKSARININSSDETIEWLDIIDNVDELVIDRKSSDNNVNILEGIGSHPLVMNAKKLEITRSNDINDDQLLNLKCEKLDLNLLSEYHDGRLRITVDGIRRLIEKVIASDYPIHAAWNFEIVCNMDTILAGFADNLITRDREAKNAFLTINDEKKLELKCLSSSVKLSIVSPNRQLEFPSADPMVNLLAGFRDIDVGAFLRVVAPQFGEPDDEIDPEAYENYFDDFL